MNKLFILLFILIVGTFFRFYKLGEFPIQLSHDEVTQLYDAISIGETGRDIYGNFLPTIFVSINDYKPPFYTYITSLFYLIFGGGEITIRLAGAIFGVLLIGAVYFLTKILFKQERIAFLASFLTAISPFDIHFSRKSFEGVIGVFFVVLASVFLINYYRNEQRKFLYFSLLCFAIGMYTYFSHAIMIPLFLLFGIVVFKDRFLGNIRQYFKPLFLFIILILPLFLIMILNPASRFRSQNVFITQDVILGRYFEVIDSSNLLFTELSKFITTLEYSFTRYLDQLNPIYIFGNGLAFTNQGPLDIGLLYLIQFPLFILGTYYLITLRNFSKERVFILGLIVLGLIPSGITFEPHSPHRSLIVYTMLNIICGCGIYYIFNLAKRWKSYLRFSFYVIFVGLFSINVIYFIHMYFVNLPYEKSESQHYPFRDVAKFSWSEYSNYDHIVFDPLFGETAPFVGAAAHYYLAYYGHYDPRDFQKEFRYGKKDREVLFDKFSVRKVDWIKDQFLKNTLVIASRWSLPESVVKSEKNIHTFYFYNGNPAFYAIKL